MASACVPVINNECDSICVFNTSHGLKTKVISILLGMLCHNYHACRGTIALTDLTDPVNESSWKGFVTAVRVCVGFLYMLLRTDVEATPALLLCSKHKVKAL